MKIIIVAYDKNYGIGAHNDLLWQLPADLQRFKTLTTGHAIIMGRKTYDSIGRVLPKRQNIVISRDDLAIEGAEVVASLEEAYAAVELGKHAYIIGGGQIYAQAVNSVQRIFATEVDGLFSADIFFPPIDLDVWKETSRERHKADERNKYNYDFVTYDRR